MHILAGRCTRILGVMAVVLSAACGSGDDTGPGQSPLVIAKTTTKSGDLQTGLVGGALPSALRVVVTRDGAPASNVGVTWFTGSGSLDPTSAQTDADGLSSSTWTLGGTPGAMTATASVTGATGSPVSFTATATDDGGPTGTIVQVLTEGGTRFDPANITVAVGTTVTWVWGTNAVGHNVVPDDGTTPAASGGLANAPNSYQYTFHTVGTFHYHCQAHGNVGGVGMSGTVTVVTTLP
jgi:plastocyanin